MRAVKDTLLQLLCVASLFALRFGLVGGFVTPRVFSTNPSANRAVAYEALPSPFLLAEEVAQDLAEIQVNAFTDEVDLFGDKTIQLLVGGFAVLVVLLVAAKKLLGEMDIAIEKTLAEFETTMKTKYAERWEKIEVDLVECNEVERAQKLFNIMEKMQNEEPEFMSRVSEDMAK